MKKKLRLFEGYGIELEYMIVDKDTLMVKPICDQVIEALSGKIKNEVSLGRVNVSNELVLHVLELKGNGPQKDLVRLRDSMQKQLLRIDRLMQERWDSFFLPTAMHPLMNPLKETRLWPHGQNEIYESYDRIFGCKGHGWSNLQSIHINLPFSGDDEFGRLHAAIRIALPLLPSISASSPYVEGSGTGILDNRLDFYSRNQKRIPSIIGSIIPEKAFTKSEYEKVILEPIYRDIADDDPDGILQDEWINSRGAIARFERNAIEIRVVDIQESLRADFALIALIVSLIESLVDETWISYESQREFDEFRLREVFMGSIMEGPSYLLRDRSLLECFGCHEPVKMGDLWIRLREHLLNEHYEVIHFEEESEKLVSRGALSSLLIQKLGKTPCENRLKAEFMNLRKCLVDSQIYS
ncbi:MAG: glutamate--cysteine ligase [Oligoflexales bacterium]|nr:glutamate--cysteine ligase [Oligoflexales bacterium]